MKIQFRSPKNEAHAIKQGRMVQIQEKQKISIECIRPAQAYTILAAPGAPRPKKRVVSPSGEITDTISWMGFSPNARS